MKYTEHNKGLPRVKSRGFTLLELLVVMAIIAILATILIFVLNPAETLRRARDSQRLSDLATLKKTITFYMLEVEDFSLGPDEYCEDNDDPLGLGKIWLSARVGTGLPLTNHPDPTGTWDNSFGGVSDVICPDSPPLARDTWDQLPCSDSEAMKFNGSGATLGLGWLPIRIQSMASPPMAHWPIDPINKGDEYGYEDSDSLIYRYTCKAKNTGYVCPADTWEINAVLESEEYRSRMQTDGGDSNLYEIGTCLFLLPAF